MDIFTKWAKRSIECDVHFDNSGAAMHKHSETVDSLFRARAQPRAANDSVPVPEMHSFTFTGSGKEYFRIWVVNLLLTVASLGIYSAWAKVRRLQYFDRNTRLAGAVFDFRGEPKAILKGRLLAVVLLAAYQYAFGFSLAIGLAIVGVPAWLFWDSGRGRLSPASAR